MKILVVTLSNLGDVILTLPVFSNLLDAYPKAELHVIVGTGALEVFSADRRIQKVIPYDKKMPLKEKFQFLQGIRRERYDLIIDLRKSWVGLLGGAKSRNSYISFSGKKIHKSIKHLTALKTIGLKASLDKASFLDWQVQKSNLVDGISQESSRLVVAAVGSKSDIKKWPAEYYAKLLDRLAKLEGCQVVLIGDGHDNADASKVESLMIEDVKNLCGKTDFKELCSIIQKAALVITNDSAPLHIADSLKIPTLAIFGPTDPKKYGPRFSGSAALRREIFCSPCEEAQCRYHHECMNDLDVDEVYKRAASLLNDELRAENFKILVIRLDRIGDLILSFPAIEALRAHFPNAHLALMVRSYTEEIAQSCPWVDEVIAYRYERGGQHRSLLGYCRFVHEIIRRKFDAAFILHPSVRSHLLPALCGIPYRVGFDSYLPFLLTTKVPDRRHEGLKSESDATLDIVKAFGVRVPSEKELILSVFPEDEYFIESILNEASWQRGGDWIAFHPGASCVSKRWSKESFALLGRKLVQEENRQLVVIGGEETVSIGLYLKETIGERVLDLTGKLNLKQTAALLKKCEVLISNDSGPVHLAAAVGTRTLAVFGRNQAGLSPVRWKALGEGHRFIQKDVGCVVCLAHACTIDFECLKAIEVSEVFSRWKEMSQVSIA